MEVAAEMKGLQRFVAVAALSCLQGVLAQDTIPEIEWSPGQPAADLAHPTLMEVPASACANFFFPYYLYVPADLPKERTIRLLVEPNNTGRTSDDFEVHRQSAKHLVSGSYARRLAERLRTPLLVPVFPRPHQEWRIYTHALDRDSLLIRDGPLARIDLQLLAMMEHARAVLLDHGISTKPKVLMNGFSASGNFVNRFVAIHPEAVRAVAAGGVNGLPIFPLETYQDVELPYPIGVADLRQLSGLAFDSEAYGQVSQYIYMGYLDRNDTFPFGDAWNDTERGLIAKLFGKEMMPDRWDRSRNILSEMPIPAQTVTYNGVAHRVLPEMWDDVVSFFQANDGNMPTTITPHQYPFVAFPEIREAHVISLYWKGDPNLSARYARFSGRQTFLIEIKQWMEGQGHQQLTAFVQNAGFEFDLVANGREDVHVDHQAFCGTTSFGDGEFKGFYVCLDAESANRVAPGVAYSLRPKRNHEGYFWTVPPDVTLMKR